MSNETPSCKPQTIKAWFNPWSDEELCAVGFKLQVGEVYRVLFHEGSEFLAPLASWWEGDGTYLSKQFFISDEGFCINTENLALPGTGRHFCGRLSVRSIEDIELYKERRVDDHAVNPMCELLAIEAPTIRNGVNIGVQSFECLDLLKWPWCTEWHEYYMPEVPRLHNIPGDSYIGLYLTFGVPSHELLQSATNRLTDPTQSPSENLPSIRGIDRKGNFVTSASQPSRRKSFVAHLLVTTGCLATLALLVSMARRHFPSESSPIAKQLRNYSNR